MAKSCCENWEAITTNILTIECVMDDDPGIFPMPWLTNDNHLKASIDQIVCISVNKTRTTQYTLSIVNIANCQTSGLAASTIGTICTRQYLNLTSFSFTIKNDFKITTTTTTTTPYPTRWGRLHGSTSAIMFYQVPYFYPNH